MTKQLVAILAVMVCGSSFAWDVSENVTINELVQWEGEVNAMAIFSNNKRCYIAVEDKTMYSLLLTMYATQKTLIAHCSDAADTIYGWENVHKIHRIRAIGG